jgi:hypothetical protein
MTLPAEKTPVKLALTEPTQSESHNESVVSGNSKAKVSGAKDETRKLVDSFKAKYGQPAEPVDSIDQIMSKYRKPDTFESDYEKIKRKYLQPKEPEAPITNHPSEISPISKPHKFQDEFF